MNNFTGSRAIENFEIAEARRRMGTLTSNVGMTNATGNVGNIPTLNNSTSTGYTEIQQAKQDMNRYYSSGNVGNIPTLSSSTSIGSPEIQNAKQDMNKSF